MFGYVSFAQLSAAIRGQLHRIAPDIDLIVGIPRSGMVPAYQIALLMNRLVAEVDTFIGDGAITHGLTRNVARPLRALREARHILLVDDSLASGRSMTGAHARIRQSGYAGRISTCAAIVTPSRAVDVDLSFISMPLPRIFEWNAFHHPCVAHACFDLDGVLCADPTAHDNDDGPRYRRFLRSAQPLFLPSLRIGHIVSARLEKYREQTQEWLAAHGISYGALHLLDLPDKAERQRRAAHCTHKIRVYRESDAALFYESDPGQAREIARGAGKPVLCVGDMSMVLPDTLQLRTVASTTAWRLHRPLGQARGWLRLQLRNVLRAAAR